ncbi:hypothetical protein K1T71_000037 [Dendrolimus kikuchii]|uniref:Uncharacterized protein n=1 Tax=Dendrolimus kikuchii TaxID=765133 RepID=A0ACC1DI21_9NEOP|nr:hypothetical protein K1T71_000037 [Dendrolimus kikuchii]
MRPAGVTATLLLLVTLLSKVSAVEDIYWEGEDPTEFLEVNPDNSFVGHLKRIKRGFFDFDWSFGSTESPNPENLESVTEDDDIAPEGADDETNTDGSGVPDNRVETELREKTLRVTFVVMEPYSMEYSNRDSVEFQNFSKDLADAVNLLFESLPGTQRASLVRIQSRLSDNFSCKVTLDIVTSGYEDTDRITQVLKDHIRTRRSLGHIPVSDADFSANVIDPGTTLETCDSDKIQCDDGSCVYETARCDGTIDCADGSDEASCPKPEQNTTITETGNAYDQRRDEENTIDTGDTNNGYNDNDNNGYNGSDNGFNQETGYNPDADNGGSNYDPNSNTYGGPDTYAGVNAPDSESIDRNKPDNIDQTGEDRGDTDNVGDNTIDNGPDSGNQPPEDKSSTGEEEITVRPKQADRLVCPEGDMVCDETRCVALSKRCDGLRDCYDGTDEANCPSPNPKICGEDDFRCSNGMCIPAAYRCNSVADCPDREDEVNCDTQSCPADSFQCDQGSWVRCAKFCDGNAECDNGEDEEDCPGSCNHKCDGRCLEDKFICDGKRDCSDYSDELNCVDCDGVDDFRCTSGECINAALRCNGDYDCQDYSDELECNITTIATPVGCSDNQFTCGDGSCIDKQFVCDHHQDCYDNTDEDNCRCDDSENFQCRSGQCIPSEKQCDGISDCDDRSDEENCLDTTPWAPAPYPVSPTTASPVFTTTGGPIPSYPGRPGEPDYSKPRPGGPGGPGRPGSSGGPGVYGGGGRPDDSGRGTGTYGGGSNDPYGQPGSQGGPGGPGGPGSSGGPGVYGGNGRPDDSGRGTDPYRGGSNDPYGQPGGPGGAGGPGSSGGPGVYGGSGRPDDSGRGTGTYGGGSNDPYGQPGSQGAPGGAGGPGSNGGSGLYGGSGRPDDSGRGTGAYGGSNDPYRQPGSQGGPGGAGEAGPSGNNGGVGQPGGEYDPYGTGRDNGPSQGSSGPGGPGSSGPVGGSNAYGGQTEFLGPEALNLKTYPTEQVIRYGGDVVFQCRDEGPLRAPVRWVREGGKSLKPGFMEKNGRLELFKVSMRDSGVYICQAPRYLGNPGAEKQVSLAVEPAKPTPPPLFGCKSYEATCANGECIPKSAVCDGKRDCSDNSDEDACQRNGMCEPNEFECTNHKCILKTWLCDSDDDCGDGSDEKTCSPPIPGQPCLASEFACSAQDQCIPKSFHCDGQSDCLDGSDEISCAPVHVVRPPSPGNLQLNPGETLILTCEAVGVPVPLISWRLNWGHVPPNCESVSEDGSGTLTCTNMQPEHSGAYSCEAINNKGTNFAVPDAIVHVNKTDLCPSGYFNSEARSQNECIRCFCFGESNQCHSADLFTYNMPTPLGTGGTRLVGVTISPTGDIRTDAPINSNFDYQPLRNGAAVTKVSGPSDWQGWSRRDAHPYITLPETYNGNQLTSYGGRIRYTLASHAAAVSTRDNAVPTIIIKSLPATLHRSSVHRAGGRPTLRLPRRGLHSRNRLLHRPSVLRQILDNIEMILLRADLNNAGVNITDFAMESAQHINVGLGAANLVEECTCPPGYEGLSCEKCAAGYTREKSGPWLGNCVRESCPAGTYGDPASGFACRPCPCPLTNRENQFARTCALGQDGQVVCDCNPGYEGAHCEVCAPGYEGNPLLRGDSCKPAPQDNCNKIGTRQVKLLDECECKDNVQGRYCDQCKNDSYYLSADFRHGCALCFCSGVSQQCRSSNLRRKTTYVQFNVPQIVQDVKLFSSSPADPYGAVRYTNAIETDIKPDLYRGTVVVRSFPKSRQSVYYWSLPNSFASDKVTSYGGYLRYTLQGVPQSASTSNSRNDPDVQLISNNHLTFHYVGQFTPAYDGTLNASVQILEKDWQRADGKEVSREHFLLALADVKTILVKASYSPDAQLATPLTASIETAEENGDGPLALHVEQCVCPEGYVGSSCEGCAPGYTRSSSGLYLEHCGPCDCNGHSSMCNPESGVCYDCSDNTDGPHCDDCKPGYERDYNGNCVRTENNTPGYCRCDPRGVDPVSPCDSDGNCICKANVEDSTCDDCRPGTFGLDTDNPQGCISCYCSGVTNECHEGSHYTRVPMAAPIFGPNYGGYTLMDLNAETVLNDHFLPVPDKSELTYVFSFPPNVDLYWSLPVFPGNRVLSYSGILSLKQEFRSDSSAMSEPGTDIVLVGDDLSVYWSNPERMRSGEPMAFQVPLRESGWYVLNTASPASRSQFMQVLKNLRRVLVRATLVRNILSTTIADVSMDTATENFYGAPPAKGVEVCMCPPGHTGTSCESCAAQYYKDINGNCRECPCNGNDCQLDSYGRVTCNCQPPYTGPDCSTFGPPDSSYTTTTQRTPMPPTVVVKITSPTIRIQEVGSSVNFTCEAQSRMTSNPLRITWNKVDGVLPQGRSYVDEAYGILFITQLQISDSGQYVCTTTDGVSSGQAVATLKVPGSVMTEPRVSIRPNINDYYEGDRVELECVVSGNPTPTISWQRGANQPLPVSAEQLDELFIIESAKEEDSGEYRCIGSNTLGNTYSTTVISIRPKPYVPPRDHLKISPSAPSVTEGQSTTIVCTAPPSVPAGTLDWIRQDGSSLLANVRSDNGVLYIDYARPENQGVYICQSVSSDVSPVPILITVITTSTPSPSNITVSVDHLKIPTGGTGTVDCNPQGSPLPMIKWMKHSGKFGPGTSQRGNTLIVSGVTDEDQGYYMCEGIVDNVPVASIYVFVEVERREPPRVEIWPPGEQAVSLGSQYELHCRVMAGIPEPDVMWSRNGGRELSRHVQILPQNILRFENIDVNDEGEYTCTATNSAGSESASASIKVRSPPEITLTPSDYVKAEFGEPVTVECRANGYPEPLVSIKSIADQREIVPPAPGIASLRISSASYNDEGDYTCTATSAAGTIENQFRIIVADRGDISETDFERESGSGEIDIGNNNIGPGSPGDMQPPSSLVALEGRDEIAIECNSPPGYEVEWDRGDRRSLQPNAEKRGSRLIIRNLSKADSGDYICSLTSTITGVVQQAAYTRLLVVSAPKITLRPPTQVVHPGQSPNVECVVDGEDIIDVTWRPYSGALSSRVEIRDRMLIFHNIEVEDAGRYECIARTRIANASGIAEVMVTGAPESPAQLVSIDQPRRMFRVGENVNVLCRSQSRDVRVKWEKPGTNEYVDFRVIRKIYNVLPGAYKEIRAKNRSLKFEGVLKHLQTTGSQLYPGQNTGLPQTRYTARLRDSVDLPCTHDLEPPFTIEWAKEFSVLPSEVRTNQPILRLERVTEADAGTYICRISNNRATIEARAILQVEGIVPRFNGESWLSLPTLKDAYKQFDIEVSFKPADSNGLILYNSQNQGRTGDYLALQLIDGVPQFIVDTGTGPLEVKGDHPLQLNTWHTIRLSKSNSRITMDVGQTGPFIAELDPSSTWAVLELKEPLYIGGVPYRDQLPETLAGAPGTKTDFLQSLDYSDFRLSECSTTRIIQHKRNIFVLQEYLNELGYICICATGYAGQNCSRTGEACRIGLCGPGKCTDTADGYKCACPVTHSGRNCESKQNIEYPAFTGSAYFAIKPPETSRSLKMSMKIKAMSPVTDGIIMYCAESSRGYGGFTSLTVHNGRLEFTYDLGKGIFILETPMFVGGVDESIILNKNAGVTAGFSGCIKDLKLHGTAIDFMNSSIQSVNVQDCQRPQRGDIPESDGNCQCKNGGACTSDYSACSCPAGFTGRLCEIRSYYPPQRSPPPSDPCIFQPCRNGGTCRYDPTSKMNHTCDCPLGYAGAFCQMLTSYTTLLIVYLQIIAKLQEENMMSLSVDRNSKTGSTTGISNIMNADSNIYIGGIPDNYNIERYPGLTGCIEQVELMSMNRGLQLGQVAVAGRNTQRCKDESGRYI